MAFYQNSTVDSDRVVLGNYKIETAASAAASYVNMGAGQLTSFQHVFEKFTSQAGNAPDPIEGIAVETANFAFDLLEYDASVFSALQNGLVSSTVTTSQSTLEAGGNQTLTARAYKLTNTSNVPSGTSQTVITIFKGTIDSGVNVVTKSDNDSDPVNAFQFTITAELDTARTAGTQLYTIVKDEV